jgi:SAM-dependent methyltransferase
VAPATAWGLGDYPRMAERLAPAAEAVVAMADVGPGDRVADVACGTGNAALAAAARGAEAVGLDFEPALLAVAAERARRAGLDVTWRPSDVAALDLPDDASTAVLSVFGAMYAPDAGGAAGELARVCAPDGRVALAAWPPGSFMPAMGAALAPFLPPPPAGAGPPSRWGEREAVAALLAGAGLTVTETATAAIDLQLPGVTEAVAFLVATAGHVLAERPALEAAGRWPALLAALHGLVAARAGSRPGGGVRLALDYVITVARPA